MASQKQPTSAKTEGEQTIGTPLTDGSLPQATTYQPNTAAKGTEPNSEQPSPPTAQIAQSNPRLLALQTKKANLEATLATLQTQKAALVASSTLPSGLSMPDSWTEEEKTKSALSTANAVINEHITLLHKYNEIKDIAQGLMGLIAESRGVRVKVVMEEFGMGEGD